MNGIVRISLSSLLLLAAASSQAGDAKPKTTVGDPAGDSFGVSPDPDLNLFSAATDGTNLILLLGFVNPISPFDSGQADALGGEIELDTDRNAATGAPAGVDALCPLPAGIGVEAEVNLASYDSNTGQLQVTDANIGTNNVGATFTANTVEITIPLAFLSGPGTGIVDAAVIVGSPIEATDCAPDGGFITSSPLPSLEIPTLQGWGLALLCGSLILAGLGVMRRRRLT